MCRAYKELKMPDKIKAEEYIVNHLLGEKQDLTEDSILDDWKQASPENRIDLEKYQQIWDGVDGASKLQNFDSEIAWNSINSKIESRNSRFRILKNVAFTVSGMAATLLIFLGLNFYTSLFSKSEPIISMSTTYGSRSEVLLPDGTVVKLNAGSSLKYHFDTSDEIRNVSFSGEGFFEVAKSKQPFVIHAPNGLNIKVLGTKFNLSAYPEDRLTQTSLVEGRVELSHSGSASLILNPGQIASYDNISSQLSFSGGEVSQNLGWMQNKLYMDNMSLQEVCARLERWYDVDITFGDKKLGDRIHYTGVIREQSVLDVLDAMCRLSTIRYQVKGKEIIISGK
jgi:transmembrane sensor